LIWIFFKKNILKEEINTPSQLNAANTQAPLKTPHKATTPGLKGTAAPPDSTNLKNFFQNLLNKNAPSATIAQSMAMAPSMPLNTTPVALPKDENTSSNHFF
jgi:hypothetical protein